MWPDVPETQELLAQARRGEPAAAERLLARHREPVRRMIGLRLDPANAVAESDETNNSSRGAGIDLTPLVVSSD